jgi:hypothetical protein
MGEGQRSWSLFFLQIPSPPLPTAWPGAWLFSLCLGFPNSGKSEVQPPQGLCTLASLPGMCREDHPRPAPCLLQATAQMLHFLSPARFHPAHSPSDVAPFLHLRNGNFAMTTLSPAPDSWHPAHTCQVVSVLLCLFSSAILSPAILQRRETEAGGRGPTLPGMALASRHPLCGQHESDFMVHTLLDSQVLGLLSLAGGPSGEGCASPYPVLC